MKTLRLLLCVLACGSAYAQPALQSEHLADPDLLVDVLRTNAEFWLDDAWDTSRGGFYTNVARDGRVNFSWGSDKNVLTQSRNTFAFVRAFQLTGEERFLDAARSALDFQYAHGWDATNGGWYEKLGPTGTVQGANSDKTSFIQHYAVLGPLAMWEATGNPTDRQWTLDGLAWNDAHLWDSRTGLEGYFDRVRRDGSSGTGKGFNATVDAFTTHAFALNALEGSADTRQRLNDLVANVQDRLLPTMDDGVIGFAEQYSTDWNVLSGAGDQRRTIMGHVLKTAWVLARYAEVTGETQPLADAQMLADHVLARGYDHEFGGPYKDYDRFTGEMLLYGLQDSTKAWWQMEQAVTAGLELYRQTGEERWVEMADETMAFFMDHFQDATFGEVYADVTRDGRTIPQWGNLFKGDNYKAAYHSAELAYLAHLYATLYVHGEPATVYYRFDAAPALRTIPLNPIDAGPDGLRLASATLGGQPLAVDAIARTVTIPADVSGVVTATFSNPEPVVLESAPLATLSLSAPAPNPARGRVRLRASLAAPADVSLTVHDALGREVAVLARGPWPAGDQSVSFDTAALASGVYIVRLSASGDVRTTMLTVVR
ncbi:AGE family epimerase/isomerase [Rubricoccus marinus]|uniref:Secretion system C-terminal sorting domain-containing protein n=1 Tax=Rubricoccus marinus TaxID=716817 RepID=A0A259TYL1_9BACT|nr:AGE family epimerase/isomerase [Rubricoccus marinus]OZC02707.1 hypothetical protein BSZ36_06790 [Rubricoccus marinus]